jgi:hypothetical protein
MLATATFSARIPLAPLLMIGTEAQATSVHIAGPIGTTLLTIEHCYGGVTLAEHAEAVARLEEIGTRFKRQVSESSVAGLPTYVLTDFLQKQTLFIRDSGEFPFFLTDLLTERNRYLLPSNQAPSVFGAAAHLGGLVGISFNLLRPLSGDLGLHEPHRGIILDFPSGKAEMQITPIEQKIEGSRDLLALVSLYLRSLSEITPDRELAGRMINAAQEVFPE